MNAAARIGNGPLTAYALYGMPLALAAFPVYIHVPKFYAETLGLSLAWVGAILLAVRALDAILDPALGVLSDRTHHLPRGRLFWLGACAPLFALGLVALFRPAAQSSLALAVWLAASMGVVYFAFSLCTIAYQAYGAELTADTHERTRVTAFREAFTLFGILGASALPEILSRAYGVREGFAMFAVIAAVFVLVVTVVTLLGSPRRTVLASASVGLWDAIRVPLRNARFRELLAVFVLNGIAAAIPATLVLFYVADVLMRPDLSAHFLVTYFVAGAACMPLWTWLSRHFGKGRAGLLGMALAIVAFVWAFFLRAGDVAGFFVICALSGAALGADLALPPSLLADVIDDDEKVGKPRLEGAYFGVWSLVTKLNLAIAAGVALPLLSALGYQPGRENAPSALAAVSFIYALLPCVLKAMAAWVLLRSSFVRANARGALLATP